MIDEMTTNNALARLSPNGAGEVKQAPTPSMLNVELMREIYQIASIFSASNLVPECYRGGEKSVGRANCFAALSMGFELGIAPMQALSHIVVINGRPAIDGQLAISLANKRAPIKGGIQYEEGGEGEAAYCIAWAIDAATGTKREYKVSIDDAKKAGWLSKSSSHWQRDPKIMLRYRSASYLVRTCYPEAVMGMHTIDELQDAQAAQQTASTTQVMERLDNLDAVEVKTEEGAEAGE